MWRIGGGCVPTWISAGKAAASSDASAVTPPRISAGSRNALSTQVCQPSFFQRLAPRLDAHAIDQAEHDQFVSQQLQGPVAAALGRVATGQFDQPLCDIALDLDLGGARRLPPAQQGEVQA